MNVRDLIALLQQLPPDMPVYRSEPGQNFEVDTVGELPFKIIDNRFYVDLDSSYYGLGQWLDDYLKDAM